MRRGGRLLDARRGDRARGIRLDDGSQGVHAGRLEPQLGPARSRSRPLARSSSSSRSRSVALPPACAVRYAPTPRWNASRPDPCDELLQHRRALVVGDRVEVHLDVAEVADLRDDRMRRRELVLLGGVRLLVARERGPDARELGDLRGGERRRPGRERLVQPQVVPPLHRHRVAEPHVAELVQHDDRALLAPGVGDARPEQVALVERDRADVLHGAPVVLGHEDLVVLAVRVGHAEGVLVEREPGLHRAEHHLGLGVLRERGAREQPERARHARRRCAPCRATPRTVPR